MPGEVLQRLIERPSLVAAVQSLEPRHLQKLIEHVGIEDCGEIVGLATTDQLRNIFDEDLWKSDRPGRDEVFDADRFALWVEVMLEPGDDFAARKLAELDEDLLTLLFHRRFVVLDTGALRLALEDGGAKSALVEKVLDGCLYEEIGDYQVIARRQEGWDAMLSLLLALDKEDHGLVERLLAHCCALSSADVEEKGLYQVLTSEEMLEGDVAAERAQRRAAQGFIAPSAAASFLGLCRITPPERVVAEPRDAVTRFYFRDRGPLAAAPAIGKSPGAARLEALIAGLDETAARRGADTRRLLAGSPERVDAAAGRLLEHALAILADRDAEAAARRIDELGYLANVLGAGCAFGRRAFRPFEAALAAAATCNLGLERLASAEEDASSTSAEHAADLLARHGADKAFRIGFWMLHHEVVVATGQALERALRRHAGTAEDDGLRRDFERLAGSLHAATASMAPWRARHQLDEIASLFDAPTCQSLLSLLSEYPALSGTLSGGIAARAHRFEGEQQLIATADDLRRVRAFLDRL